MQPDNANNASHDVVPIADHWQQCLIVAAILAVDDGRLTGGVILRGAYGAARDAWLTYLEQSLPKHASSKRIPANISDGRLLGGLDLTATLASGKPVAERGVLAASHGGVIIIPMAERLPAATAAKITSVIDRGAVNSERDGFVQQHPAIFRTILLDETAAAEGENAASCMRVSPALADRLAFHIDISDIPCHWLVAFDNTPNTKTQHHLLAISATDINDARARLPAIQTNLNHIETLVAVAASLGINSLRAPILALNVAKIIAALNARQYVGDDDLKLAAQLVLSPRACMMPAMPADEKQQAEHSPEPPHNTPPEADNKTDNSDPPSANEDQQQPLEDILEDVVLEAVAAAIPAKLREQLMAARIDQASQHRHASVGRAGQLRHATLRGRVVGTLAQAGGRDASARLNILATLRAAAPWQRIRHMRAGLADDFVPNTAKRIHIRRDDFRLNRYQQRSKTTTIFLVDASGSSALNRLAEAKGAVELLLADCYIRRDQVAVIAFRGKAADILLPPTRSLVRAKRSLAALPGGGGTPLAAGLDAARVMAETIQRGGDTVMIVVLTDGRANINRLGIGDRVGAETDAISAATAIRLGRIKTLMIDTSPNRNAQAANIATAMNAIYLPLPYAAARTMADAVAAASAVAR